LKKVPFLDLIESWKALAKEVTDFMRDPANTEFILVTIPEALGVYQAQRLVGEFERYGLSIGHLIINNVIQDPDCEFHKARKAMQMPYINMLADEYGDGRMKIIQLPLFAYEMKGVERLKELEKVLFRTRG
jgi:arsenite-transporting ATPase